MARIAIAGAGLLGRLLAWRLGRAGHAVEVFDPAASPEPLYDGHGPAGFSAAGMLSPLAEMDSSEPAVAALGWRSIPLWRAIADALLAPELVARHGSLLLAHRDDLGSAERVLSRMSRPQEVAVVPQPLDAAALAALEPALHGAAHAWLLPGEGQIDPPATLRRLQERAGPTVRWRWRTPVARLTAGAVITAQGDSHRFDWVFDVRGLAARAVDSGDRMRRLRGVRGETVWLAAPAHGLTRPVRLLHPRHTVYLVPRTSDRVFVGASDIESEDRSPVSLRSAVELMAAAHSVMPGLAEARIERMDRNLRPALPDNLPRTEIENGLVRINGLYRHGWLLAPALVDDALAQAGISSEPAAPDTP